MSDQVAAQCESEQDLLTLPEYAARCRTTPETVRYWRKTGYGPRGFRLGRRVVYDRREVEEFIASQRAAAAGGA